MYTLYGKIIFLFIATLLMSRSSVLRIIDALFLARPVLWIPVWGFCAFGYFSGLVHNCDFSFSVAWSHQLPVFCRILVFSFSVGAVYVFNQMADRHVDEKNAGFPLLVKGNIPLWIAWSSVIVLALGSLCIPLFNNWKALSAFAAAALLLGVLYSVKPMFFTGRFLLDFLTNATGYGIVSFGVGWYLSGAELFSRSFAVYSVPYFFLMCAGSISSTIPDYEGDRKCGKNTTAVAIGTPQAHLMASCFLCASLGIALFTKNWVPVICAGLGMPFYIIFCFYKTQKTMEATYKIGGMISMVVAGMLFPLLIPASLITLVATVLYFRIRYHITYPSLIPVSNE